VNAEPGSRATVLWEVDTANGPVAEVRQISPTGMLTPTQSVLPSAHEQPSGVSSAPDGTTLIWWFEYFGRNRLQTEAAFLQPDGTLGAPVALGVQSEKHAPEEFALHAIRSGQGIVLAEHAPAVTCRTISQTGELGATHTALGRYTGSLVSVANNASRSVVAEESVRNDVSSIYATTVGADCNAAAPQLLARGTPAPNSGFPVLVSALINARGDEVVSWGLEINRFPFGNGSFGSLQRDARP